MKNHTKKQGFTLLEMIISIGIFSVLVIASIGVTLGVSNAQIKAANIQAILDSIRFSLELITKEMRTGSGYAATSYGAACGGASGSEISFTTALGESRTYYLSPATKTIMRMTQTTNCVQAVPFSSEEVNIDRLNFALSGSASGPNDGQPRVTLTMKARSKSPKYYLESSLDLQTTVAQRLRDL
ncbi:MAG: type II secretion system protein [Candidatus Sungiibacteriota bacterium]|uniref:Type II secretion system protein n=1 Tax=Candidatus Sungiibacteriota bacterium TaxID=2750080 RepID=A0A7T5UR12_9BACT|nr:MAG: type II secretion system protein [Candidatus Sungbacteria bacterium]